MEKLTKDELTELRETYPEGEIVYVSAWGESADLADKLADRKLVCLYHFVRTRRGKLSIKFVVLAR